MRKISLIALSAAVIAGVVFVGRLLPIFPAPLPHASAAITATDLQFDGGEGSLQIIRGHVDAGGNVVSGAGFTAHLAGSPSNGIAITFNTPFKYIPAIVAVADNPASPFRFVSANGSASVNGTVIVGYAPTGGGENPTLAGFDFIAVGPAANPSPCVQSAERLYVLRGTVSGGSVTAGSGFTASAVGGRTTINFPAGMFTGAPAVVAISNNGSNPYLLTTLGATPTAVNASVYTYGLNGNFKSGTFDFIAIGSTNDATGCPVKYVDNEPAGKIVRGNVAGNGTVIWGTGYTATGKNGIYYPIGFSPAFLTSESGVSTVDDYSGNGNFAVSSGSTSPSSKSIIVYSPTGNAKSAQFDFVTIGRAAPVPPVIMLTANPGSVNAGQSSVLTWAVSGATSCTASASPADASWTGSRSTAGGTQSVTPGATTVYTLSCTGAGGQSSQSATVNVAAVNNVTVTVTSENSADASVPVPASWTNAFAIGGSIQDPCAVSGNQCSGTAQTYHNLPPGIYGMANLAVSSSIPHYALRSVEEAPIAQRPTAGNSILAFFSGLIRTVEAEVTCGFLNSAPSSCPLQYGSITPSNGDTANFVLLWDPQASISVNPANLPLSASKPNSASGNITVTNNGATSSVLQWSGSSSDSWLTISPASGVDTAGASTSVTVTANATGLSVGTHTGTVTFSAQSCGSYPCPPPQTLTVTFTVNPPASSITSVSASCTPNPVYAGNTSQCTATVSGNPPGGYATSVIWGTTSGTISASGLFTAPASAGTATITATSTQDATQSGSSTVSVLTAPPPTCSSPVAPGDPVSCSSGGGGNCVWSAPGGIPSTSGISTSTFTTAYSTSGNYTVTCGGSGGTPVVVENAPNCTLSASPSKVVPPGGTTLTWNCTPGTAQYCSVITNGTTSTQVCGTGLGTCDGVHSVSEFPTQNTQYSLSCNGGVGTTPTVSVTVGGPGQVEGNPGGTP